MTVSIGERVKSAWRARQRLMADGEVQALRLLHGWGEGVPGVEVDRYGDAVVVEHRADLGTLELVEEVVAALDAGRRFEQVVARPRGTRASPVVVRGPAPDGRTVVQEHGLSFGVDVGRAGNPGLYLDARPARVWLRANAAGRRVLNLFAFSGSLGVAAAVGGARVTHVDSSEAALAWCGANMELNGVAVDRRDLARMNIYQHIRRAQAGRQRYGGIIVDAPPDAASGTGPRGAIALAPSCARMLEPGGWMLCFFHHEAERTHDELDAAVTAAAAADGKRLDVVWRGTSGEDFPEEDPRRKLRISAFQA